MQDLALLIATSVRKAIDHTKEVCQRDRVEARFRPDRVGIFVTDLRREFGELRTLGKVDSDTARVLDRFLNTHVWEDVGVLNESYLRSILSPLPHQSHLGDRLVNLLKFGDAVEYARLTQENDPFLDSTAKLKELDAGLTRFQFLLAEMKQVNQKADSVMTNLADLADQASSPL